MAIRSRNNPRPTIDTKVRTNGGARHGGPLSVTQKNSKSPTRGTKSDMNFGPSHGIQAKMAQD